MNPDKIRSVLSTARCIYTKEQLEAAIEKMAGPITEELKDQHPVVICVMKGAIIFTSTLLSYLDFTLELEYLHATRYRHESKGSEFEWIVKPRTSLEGRTVLLLEDILDGGVTLTEIINQCKALGAEKVYTAVMLDKVTKRVDNGLKNADFVGLPLEDVFVFGYGLDYQDYLRNAPGVYEVSTEHKF